MSALIDTLIREWQKENTYRPYVVRAVLPQDVGKENWIWQWDKPGKLWNGFTNRIVGIENIRSPELLQLAIMKKNNLDVIVCWLTNDISHYPLLVKTDEQFQLTIIPQSRAPHNHDHYIFALVGQVIESAGVVT
jgi:hypothetical protein